MPSPIPAISEDYSDIIVKKQLLPFRIEERYQEQPVDRQYSILYAPLSENLYAAHQIGYISVPKLYTFISLSSLERSGILSAQTQPYLRLLGTGILIGFLDSGIDYRHPAFRKADGTTRIAALWDQSDSTGIAPEGFSYGSEYQEDAINQALFSEEPYRIVPSHDFDGHGTAVAGIACGSADPEADFTGAAPDSTLAVVKLKPAKQYLRDYFLIPDDATAFQENDLMLGIRYLIDTAIRLRMPLVICISLGSNQGSHTGNTPLEEVLSSALLLGGTYVVAGTGNEAGMSHHYYGKLKESRWNSGQSRSSSMTSASLLRSANRSSLLIMDHSPTGNLPLLWKIPKFMSITLLSNSPPDSRSFRSGSNTHRPESGDFTS